MARYLLIPFSLIFLVNTVYSDEFKPSETLDYFCPCKLTASCKTVFGEGSSGHVYKDILKSIPQCLTGTVRCCSKQVMFTALMIILSDHEVELNDKAKTPAEALEVKSKQGKKFFLPAIAPESVAPLSRNGPGRAIMLEGVQFNDLLDRPQGPFINAIKTLSQGPSAGNLPKGVQCIPLNECSNVYGTKPEHFAKHGFVSPIQNNCFADSGNILCVIEEPVASSPPSLKIPAGSIPAPPVSNPAPGPAPATAPLPCKLPQECLSIYGTDSSHFTSYTIQDSCPDGNLVRCVTPLTTPPPVSPSSLPVIPPTLPTIPTLPTLPALPQTLPTVPTLPTLPSFPQTLPPTLSIPAPEIPSLPAGPALSCLPESSCSVVYGTQPDHFDRFGIQQPCPVQDQVRCVTPSNNGGTHPGHGSHGVGHGSHGGGHGSHGVDHGSHGGVNGGGHGSHGNVHGSHSGHGSNGGSHTNGHGHISTGGLPVGPVAPSVSIIGPQPVYVTYNNIKGPSVGGDNSLLSGGQVDSSGVNPSQEAQINILLQALKSKLSGIING